MAQEEIVETKKIRWRAVVIEALLSRTEHRIGRLRDFYNEGEFNFDSRLRDLKDEADRLVPEQWDGLQDHYIDELYDLEELRELKRNFSIVGLFTVFEIFLRRMLTLILVPPGVKDRKALLERVQKKRWNLDDMKKKFREVGLPITEPNTDWNAIKRMNEVRNCITHHAGQPNKEMMLRLKKINFPVNDAEYPTRRMKLPPEYFEESAVIVERVCRRIAKEYGKALIEKRLKSIDQQESGWLASAAKGLYLTLSRVISGRHRPLNSRAGAGDRIH